MVSDQSEQLPLLVRQPADPIAIITNFVPALGAVKGTVSAADFLAHATQLSRILPDHRYLINLCGNRYLFSLTLCAAVIRGQTNLLPPNRKTLTQSLLQERYQDIYIVHDGLGDNELVDSIPSVSWLDLNLSEQEKIEFTIPLIDKAQVAAISFTSGSTGDSQPNIKTWQTLFESSKINANHMLDGLISDKAGEPLHQLATVPPQHMWGLETSVLLPLFAPVCVADSKPLYPNDILDALNHLPEPRMLVSTPVHLRALHLSGLSFPHLTLVLCATSPLTAELAKQIESLFSQQVKDNAQVTVLREVYGCSEVGSMALRSPSSQESWRMFEGIHLSQQNGEFVANTDYLPSSILLQDRMLIMDDGSFKLNGRASDLVDIAGKRGSLAELNKVLINFKGLIDGIIFIPESDTPVKQMRLAGLVVLKPGFEINSLRRFLAEHVDNAFVPRPIIQVTALPREENGKLPRKILLSFYEKAKEQK